MISNIYDRFFYKPKWEYYNLVTNPEFWEYDEPYHRFRFDQKTNTLQAADTHCLGLNPPTYIKKYYTIKVDATFKQEGEFTVVDESKIPFRLLP